MQRMRRLYAERKQSLIAALEAQFGAALRLDRTGTGLHLVAHLRAGSDDAAFARAAYAAGLGAHALSAATRAPAPPTGDSVEFHEFDAAQRERPKYGGWPLRPDRSKYSHEAVLT